PRKANEVAGQVDDLHWLAHIEHEHLAAPADRPGLQNELHRLGNRHEVPFHLGVGDGDAPALGDLLLEKWDHTAPAAEHVAEAHRHEPGRAHAGQRLHQYFGHALRRTHDVARVHGFVGRYHHKAFGPYPV